MTLYTVGSFQIQVLLVRCLTLICEAVYLKLLQDVLPGLDLMSAAALLVGHHYLCQGDAAVN